MIIEVPYTAQVVWQSDRAKTVMCPNCGVAVRTQYEGDEPMFMQECNGRFGTHKILIGEQ